MNLDYISMSTAKKFNETLVGDVYDLIVKEPSKVVEEAGITEVIDSLLKNPMSRTVYVVDAEGRYIGQLDAMAIIKLLTHRAGVAEYSYLSFYGFLSEALAKNVGDLMTKKEVVTREDTLTKALSIMFAESMDGIPVIDSSGKLIGELVCLEILHKGRELLEQ